MRIGDTSNPPPPLPPQDAWNNGDRAYLMELLSSIGQIMKLLSGPGDVATLNQDIDHLKKYLFPKFPADVQDQLNVLFTQYNDLDTILGDAQSRDESIALPAQRKLTDFNQQFSSILQPLT